MTADLITPRKRPRQARAEATVAAVIEAGARILEEGGLEGFNTNAVARRAGVSVGSLYQYFPGKDAIMAALIRREAAAFDKALTEALRGVTRLGLAGAIFTLARVAVAHQSARPRLSRLLDLEEQRLNLAPEVRGRDRRVADALAAFLAERRLGDREAALDILHMSRGLIDAALERGAASGLEMRLTRAILGYLSLPPEAVAS